MRPVHETRWPIRQVWKCSALTDMGFVEGFVHLRTQCGVQSSPLVFTPNRAFDYGSLPGQEPGGSLCF